MVKVKNFSNYLKGVANGDYEQRYENGNIKVKGKLRNEQKNGLWEYFDSNGYKIREINY